MDSWENDVKDWYVEGRIRYTLFYFSCGDVPIPSLIQTPAKIP